LPIKTASTLIFFIIKWETLPACFMAANFIGAVFSVRSVYRVFRIPVIKNGFE
jgi:hypothetical protein